MHFMRSSFGVSKKCNCSARVVMRLPTVYARQLGLVTLNTTAENGLMRSPALENSSGGTLPTCVADPSTMHPPADSVPPGACMYGSACGGAAMSAIDPSVVQPAASLRQDAGVYGSASGAATSGAATSGTESSAAKMDTTLHIRLHLQHTGHTPFSHADLVMQPVHPAIAEKVVELTLQGVSFGLLQQQLTTFTINLVEQLGVTPDAADCRFFPREGTIRNLYDATLRKIR